MTAREAKSVVLLGDILSCSAFVAACTGGLMIVALHGIEALASFAWVYLADQYLTRMIPRLEAARTHLSK